MLEIEQLYGVEILVHVPAPADIVTPGGITLANRVPDLVECTVIYVGAECKKGLVPGDKVIIFRHILTESQLVPSNLVILPEMPKGEFKLLTEYLIAMKAVSTVQDVQVNSEEADATTRAFNK